MAIVMMTQGRRASLGYLIPWLQTLTVHLFVNDFIPLPTSVYTDFVDPTYDRYFPLPCGSWSGVYLDPDLKATVNGQPLNFIVGPGGGSDNVYGFWVSDNYGNAVFAEINPGGPQPMRYPGQTYPMIPRFNAGMLC